MAVNQERNERHMSMKNETAAGTRQSAGAELSREHSSVRSTVFVALALWLGAVVFLGSKGAFVAGADSPPLAIFIGLAIPLSVFFAAYLGWGAFRAFVLNADLRLVSALQAWRWAGLGFLSLYAHGILPGLFALPAGLGDMAIGFTAPWMVLRLIRQPSFAASRRYKVWNILGIFDFVVAFSMATLSSGFIHGLGLKVTTSAMAQL